MLFGSLKDHKIHTGIRRELVHDIVEQEVGYYKIDLNATTTNIYGESNQKTYTDPVYLNCLITRGDQSNSFADLGSDMSRATSFAFIREDLVEYQTVPEVGDIVLWHEDYYEVHQVRENELFLGRDASYNLTEHGDQFGSSISIIVDCHLTRGEVLGISRVSR